MRLPLLALLAATACATASAPATTPAPHTLVASIQRGPCFGRCPVYEARLHADGVVEWNGVRGVLVQGQARAVLPPARVAEVRAALARARLGELKASYDGPVADAPWVEVGDGKRTVRRTTTEDQAPPALVELELALDRLLGTRDWVSGAVLDR
jgi:hypothetical protein